MANTRAGRSTLNVKSLLFKHKFLVLINDVSCCNTSFSVVLRKLGHSMKYKRKQTYKRPANARFELFNNAKQLNSDSISTE